MKLRASILLMIVLATAGCHNRAGTALGKLPKGKLFPVLSVKAGTTPQQVVLKGVMIEKCPVAGCWFRLQDETGVIRVDTKDAGFVVVDVPLGTQMTVAGKVVAAGDGDDMELEGTGLHY